MVVMEAPSLRRPLPLVWPPLACLPSRGTPSECLQDVYEEGTRTAALEKLKKMVPDQMTEEADEKSRPLKDPSSTQDRQTQFETYFIIFKLFYILYHKLLYCYECN